MIKIIRVGQLVTFGDAIYKAEKCLNPEEACFKCDLNKQCAHEFNIKCAMFVYLKYIGTKHYPKTRRCKRFPKSE